MNLFRTDIPHRGSEIAENGQRTARTLLCYGNGNDKTDAVCRNKKGILPFAVLRPFSAISEPLCGKVIDPFKKVPRKDILATPEVSIARKTSHTP